MEDFEETPNDSLDDESLNMFIYYIIKKFDVSAKRIFLAMFLDAMGVSNHRYSFGTMTSAYVELSKECKSRVNELLELADIIFFHSLSKKQKELYNHFSGIRIFLEHNMTGRGYIELLNACNNLSRLTGLPFSIEEKFGGLKTWDAWNDAIDEAVEEGKIKFGRKKRRKS